MLHAFLYSVQQSKFRLVVMVYHFRLLDRETVSKTGPVTRRALLRYAYTDFRYDHRKKPDALDLLCYANMLYNGEGIYFGLEDVISYLDEISVSGIKPVHNGHSASVNGLKLEPMSGQRVYGSFKVDYESRQLTIGNRPVRLSPKELQIFHLFLSNEGLIIPPSVIIASVWGDEPDVSDETIRAYIYTIRNRLGADIRDCIENIPGTGYRFKSPERLHAGAA